MKNTPWPNEKEPLPLFYALVRRARPLSESFGPPLLLPLLGCPSPPRNSFTPLSPSPPLPSFPSLLLPFPSFLLPFLDDWEGEADRAGMASSYALRLSCMNKPRARRLSRARWRRTRTRIGGVGSPSSHVYCSSQRSCRRGQQQQGRLSWVLARTVGR